MDILGIGAGVEASANVYFNAIRRTGKTTRLVESLKSGDRVVCRGHDEARHFKRMLHRQGVDGVEVVAVPTDKPFMLIGRFSPPKGRTFFDDTWLQGYFLQEIEAARRSLDRLTGMAEGGYQSAAHREEAVLPIFNGGVRL